MKYLLYILFLSFFMIFCTKKENNILLKNSDKVLIYQIFDTLKYKFIEETEIGMNEYGYMKRINLQGKKDYIPDNLHLFDSLEKLKIDLPYLKKFPDISKIKSLKFLKINILGIDEPVNVPKSYKNIECLYIMTATQLGHHSQPKSNIFFPKDLKIKELKLRMGGKVNTFPSKSLKNLSHLKYLDLEFNKLENIDLSLLPDSIYRLDMNKNNIQDIDLYKCPKSLKIIMLEDNPLKNSKKTMEDGKKLGISVWTNLGNNGVKVNDYNFIEKWFEM